MSLSDSFLQGLSAPLPVAGAGLPDDLTLYAGGPLDPLKQHVEKYKQLARRQRMSDRASKKMLSALEEAEGQINLEEDMDKVSYISSNPLLRRQYLLKAAQTPLVADEVSDSTPLVLSDEGDKPHVLTGDDLPLAGSPPPQEFSVGPKDNFHSQRNEEIRNHYAQSPEDQAVVQSLREARGGEEPFNFKDRLDAGISPPMDPQPTSMLSAPTDSEGGRSTAGDIGHSMGSAVGSFFNPRNWGNSSEESEGEDSPPPNTRPVGIGGLPVMSPEVRERIEAAEAESISPRVPPPTPPPLTPVQRAAKIRQDDSYKGRTTPVGIAAARDAQPKEEQGYSFNPLPVSWRQKVVDAYEGAKNLIPGASEPDWSYDEVKPFVHPPEGQFFNKVMSPQEEARAKGKRVPYRKSTDPVRTTNPYEDWRHRAQYSAARAEDDTGQALPVDMGPTSLSDALGRAYNPAMEGLSRAYGNLGNYGGRILRQGTQGLQQLANYGIRNSDFLEGLVDDDQEAQLLASLAEGATDAGDEAFYLNQLRALSPTRANDKLFSSNRGDRYTALKGRFLAEQATKRGLDTNDPDVMKQVEIDFGPGFDKYYGRGDEAKRLGVPRLDQDSFGAIASDIPGASYVSNAYRRALDSLPALSQVTTNPQGVARYSGGPDWKSRAAGNPPPNPTEERVAPPPGINQSKDQRQGGFVHPDFFKDTMGIETPIRKPYKADNATIERNKFTLLRRKKLKNQHKPPSPNPTEERMAPPPDINQSKAQPRLDLLANEVQPPLPHMAETLDYLNDSTQGMVDGKHRPQLAALNSEIARWKELSKDMSSMSKSEQDAMVRVGQALVAERAELTRQYAEKGIKQVGQTVRDMWGNQIPKDQRSHGGFVHSDHLNKLKGLETSIRENNAEGNAIIERNKLRRKKLGLPEEPSTLSFAEQLAKAKREQESINRDAEALDPGVFAPQRLEETQAQLLQAREDLEVQRQNLDELSSLLNEEESGELGEMSISTPTEADDKFEQLYSTGVPAEEMSKIIESTSPQATNIARNIEAMRDEEVEAYIAGLAPMEYQNLLKFIDRSQRFARKPPPFLPPQG